MPRIPLHKENRLNPTILQCFYCGKDKNEIVLLGAYYKQQAPMRSVTSYDPCDKCKQLMEKGFMLIEVEDNTDQNNPYRTGNMTVISLEAAANLFTNIDLSKQRVAFIEKSVLKHIMGKIYYKIFN